MTHFFDVQTLEQVLTRLSDFPPVGTETVPIGAASLRILAEDILSPEDIPGFKRATMDGYAVHAASTFGASESNPAWLEVRGHISMGEVPDFSLTPGSAAGIATGGMLPDGADSVVMVEHTETVDNDSVHVYKSVPPLQHVIEASEDFARDETVLKKGALLRPQEIGVAAALGISELPVYNIPTVGIISTGDEVVPNDAPAGPGKIRDINSYTLAGFVQDAGCTPRLYGIVKDDPDQLFQVCRNAASQTDMLLISGGSSVGTRDFTIDVLQSIQETEILTHGISISPGKPTILAKSGRKPLWGLPGQVASAMVVFKIVVLPFLIRLKGWTRNPGRQFKIRARLSRNIASAQGRRDFIRVSLTEENGDLLARPVLGKSGLIKTMVLADGLLEIGENVEGLEKGTRVDIIPV